MNIIRRALVAATLTASAARASAGGFTLSAIAFTLGGPHVALSQSVDLLQRLRAYAPAAEFFERRIGR